MSGPAGVTALVLAETVAGGLALIFVTPLWNEVRRGFFVLTCSILALFSAAVWGSVSAGRVTGDDAGTWSLRLALALTFVLLAVVGLLLGHWYLTDRGLTRTPINRYTNLLLVGVALEASALVLGGFGPTEATPEFNPLLTSAGLASWIALGMVAATALIGVMIRITLRGPRASAVQAATGFFYLAVITATTAEFAAKVGFLG